MLVENIYDAKIIWYHSWLFQWIRPYASNDTEQYGFVPIYKTTFMFELLEFILDIRKCRQTGLMNLLNRNFLHYAKPEYIDQNIQIHFSSTMPEAGSCLLICIQSTATFQ